MDYMLYCSEDVLAEDKPVIREDLPDNGLPVMIAPQW